MKARGVADYFDAAHVGKAEIDQHHVRRRATEEVLGFAARTHGSQQVQPAIGEHGVGEALAEFRDVFDDEDAGIHGRNGGGSLVGRAMRRL